MAKKQKDDNVLINPFFEHLGIQTYSIKQAMDAAILCFHANIVPVFISEAGLGKSAACRQIAQRMSWMVHFFFLAHLEREDIAGIPYPNTETGTYQFLCEENIRKIIDSGRDVLLSLDEWNRGEKNVMNAAFTMMEDRRFGSYVLPEHVRIMACMNPSEGSYLVNEAEKDPAFRRRLCFIGIRSDPAIWLEWASGPGDVHPDVVGAIQASPAWLLDINSRESGKVYASPASWEKVSNVLKSFDAQNMTLDANATTLKAVLGGIVGTGMTESFVEFIRENSALIDPHHIIKNYKKKGQKHVLRLVKTGRADAIMETCEGVAVTIATEEPEFDELIPNLGLFCKDLPEDATMAFFQKISAHTQELGKPKLFAELSRVLAKDKNYQAALKKIYDAEARAQAESEED